MPARPMAPAPELRQLRGFPLDPTLPFHEQQIKMLILHLALY